MKKIIFILITISASLKLSAQVGIPSYSTSAAPTSNLAFYWNTDSAKFQYRNAGTLYTIAASGSSGGLSGLTANQMMYATGSTTAATTSNFYNSSGKYSIGNSTPASLFDVASASGGTGSGLTNEMLANNSTASQSFATIDFRVPSTGLIGQFLATASNYSGSYDLNSNSIALWAESASGQLTLAAIGSSGYVSIGAGGAATSNRIATFNSAGRALFGSSTDNSTALEQITSTSQAQLALHYSPTYFGKIQVGSTGIWNWSGMSGFTMPTAALATSGSSSDSVVVIHTVGGISTLEKTAQSSLGGSVTGSAFTPTIAAGTNVNTPTLYQATYIQIGNIVMGHINISITSTTSANTASNLTFTLPVSTSTTTQAIGSGVYFPNGTSTYGTTAQCQIVSSGTTATVYFSSGALTTAGNLDINFQYHTN